MGKIITVDPLTRIEGHLKFSSQVDDFGVVVDAKTSGEMFRGIEKGLEGHDVRVAQHVTQRVCGVCPYAHAEAASLALEQAMDIKLTKNAYLTRNLVCGAYHIQDFILHFYTLCSLDFIDIAAIAQYGGSDSRMNSLKNWVLRELKKNSVFPAAPYFPRLEADYIKNVDINLMGIQHYVDAITIMQKLTKMVAIFGAKAPHPTAMEAGGVTTVPTIDRLTLYATYLDEVEEFVTKTYLSDVVAISKEYRSYFYEGKGYDHFLNADFLPDENGQNHLFPKGASFGFAWQEFDVAKIMEDHSYSYYHGSGQEALKEPLTNELSPISYGEWQNEHHKESGKYSWTRSPRYAGEPMEVGPSARLINTYLSGKRPKINVLIDEVNSMLGITIKDYNSVMGRHLSRAISAKLMFEKLREDLGKIEPGVSAFVEADVSQIGRNKRGFGMTEATRGILCHFVSTDENAMIKKYELIVPTTWNIGPRDHKGNVGPVEKMLIGTKVKDALNPMELARIVRSTDPCMACSVH